MVFLLLKSALDICCAGQSPLQWAMNQFGNDEDEVEVEKPKMKLGSKNKDTKHLHLKWSALTTKARKALTVLGWNQEKWDVERWADIEEYWWEELNEEQRAAATELGWEISSWDNQYEDKDWDELPDAVQKAAKRFGFTKEMWDDDEWPETAQSGWEEMDAQQRKALNVLGYNLWDWE